MAIEPLCPVEEVPVLERYERRILTVQDQSNAFVVMYYGKEIRLRAVHRWEKGNRANVTVTFDRAVARELARELWKAAGQCDVFAETENFCRHAEGMTSLDEETADADDTLFPFSTIDRAHYESFNPPRAQVVEAPSPKKRTTKRSTRK